MKRSRVLLVVLWICIAVQAKTEFGKLQGAEFRIDVPDNWNHGLVVYYHGYSAENHGVGYDEKKPLDPTLAVFTKAGYAVIQSGYSQGGWALEQAIPETDALRRYFIDKYERPKEIYLAGHSMGGMLTVMTIEQSPQDYAGGLDLCGAVSDAPSLLIAPLTFVYCSIITFPGNCPIRQRFPVVTKHRKNWGKESALCCNPSPKPLRRCGAFGAFTGIQTWSLICSSEPGC